MMKQRDYG